MSARTVIDLAAAKEAPDVAALAAATPQEIVVPAYYAEREKVYAATLAALALEKASLTGDSERSRLLGKAGANVAASFANFTQEPAFRWARPVYVPGPEEPVEGKDEHRPGPFALPNPKAVYVTPQVDVPAKTAAVYESIRAQLGGDVDAELALAEFRREGNRLRTAPFAVLSRRGPSAQIVAEQSQARA